ncbi:hypothetical protein LSH36_396g00020 [Paralvinella palmiformis]|uniref:Uncharacterized protein n=1 Tax=Paralvinella palmiformis TaxID=53620 RepID=A0AAD9JDK4_9ANNE|nr:hypothetical protein LSH36_396g00020 [Paralvinella palmiformis]
MSKKISILCLAIVSTIVLCCLRHCSMVDRLSVGRKLIHTVNGNVASKYVATYVIKGCRPNLKKAKYYSQFNEDEALFKNYFNDPTICGGLYVEIGALDGITYSNTKFFEDNLNWTGVLIEGHPDNAEKLTKNRSRKRNVIIQEAVCPEGQTYVNFSGAKAVGGISVAANRGTREDVFQGDASQANSDTMPTDWENAAGGRRQGNRYIHCRR